MALINKNISIEKVPEKPYCKVEDAHHVYFIPESLCTDVSDYVRKASFENREINSLQQWYLSLPMRIRTSIIVVLNQKIA